MKYQNIGQALDQDSLLDWKAKDFLARDTENSCKQGRLVKFRKFLSYCSSG